MVKLKFMKLIINCSFFIENFQAVSISGGVRDLQPIVNVRFWSTETYQTRSFNDYIFYSLKEDIKKRIIVNELNGSSWHFNRFLYLNVKVFSGLDLFTRWQQKQQQYR